MIYYQFVNGKLQATTNMAPAEKVGLTIVALDEEIPFRMFKLSDDGTEIVPLKYNVTGQDEQGDDIRELVVDEELEPITI